MAKSKLNTFVLLDTKCNKYVSDIVEQQFTREIKFTPNSDEARFYSKRQEAQDIANGLNAIYKDCWFIVEIYGAGRKKSLRRHELVPDELYEVTSTFTDGIIGEHEYTGIYQWQRGFDERYEFCNITGGFGGQVIEFDGTRTVRPARKEVKDAYEKYISICNSEFERLNPGLEERYKKAEKKK